jgi:hypothetical protein
VTYHTKTPASKAGTEAASNGGMNRDKLTARHTDTCMAQMALEQAMHALHRLGCKSEYVAVAEAWTKVRMERERVLEKLYPKPKRIAK